jgi:hypothetical protein
MRRIGKRVAVGLLTTGSLALSAAGASAQSIGFGAAGEAGGDDLHMASAELSLAAAGLGIRPFATLGGYMVFFDGGETVGGSGNNWGVTPMAGVRYVTDGGTIEGSVGWAIIEDGAFPYFRGDDSGFLGGIRTEFLGDVWTAEGIGVFNFGAEYLWSRARLGLGLGNMGTNGSWGLGAELVYQAEADDPAPTINGFQATQIGPVLMLTPSAGGATFSLSGGWKKSDFGLTDESTWYGRAEIHLR